MNLKLFLHKVLWILLHQGPLSLFVKSFQYLKKHNPRKLWYYSTRRHNYNLWLRIEKKKLQNILDSAPNDIRKFTYSPVITIIMPVWNTDFKCMEQAISSVCQQVYLFWELLILGDGSNKALIRELSYFEKTNDHIKVIYRSNREEIVSAINRAFSSASGEFVGFINGGDEIAPHALLEIARLLNKDPKIDVIYSDEDRLIGDKRCDPFFKPDWSPDLLLSMNYIGHFLVIRRQLLQELGGLREGTEGSQDYDLVLRATERTKRIAHIPEILYHWRIAPGSVTSRSENRAKALGAGRKAILSALNRRGLKSQVIQTSEGRYRVRYEIPGEPLVSIIIPTKDKGNLLRRCVESIRQKSTYYNYEIIIVNNNSTQAATKTYLNQITTHPNCRVLAFQEPFNYARLNNFAVRHVRGDYLLFLNNDTEVISPDWIEEMLGHAQRKEVGAVGVKLLFPNNTIQHAGVIIGMRGVASHAFYGLPASDPGYMGLATVTRNCAAVTAACMMMRRSVFEEVGGFDEELDVAYNDVDLCLRLIQRGYYIVWTPHAVLYHHESASRGQYQPERNIRYFCEKWREFLERGDPFYNPNLALDRNDYMVKF